MGRKMPDEFKIERGVKLPPPSWGRKKKYPIDQLEVGDSFFVPGKVHTQLSGVRANAIRKGIKLSVRNETVDGISGVRVYRIE